MNAPREQVVPEQDLLLELRRKVYPRSVSGTFARWRWAMVWLTQAVFYGLPWLSWPPFAGLWGEGGRQAVLFDLGVRKFYLFGVVLYPQDFVYLTALLLVSALSLFLFTTVAGRVWCGYACPQTVYTEIFLWIERKVEGERGRRMALDAEPWSVRKARLKATKQAAWIAVSLWTGITFVGYFTPIRTLLHELATFTPSAWELFWIGFYAFATWGNAGFLREQVCKYMCPYARFQGVMFDRDTWVVTYDPGRGEPRGRPTGRAAAEPLAPVGDCIDCGLCVQVCPTDIDIREGQQYECIGCAACIDACDKVMDKVGRPRGLIRYDTLRGIETAAFTLAEAPGATPSTARASRWRTLLRPRVLIYSAVLLVVCGALLASIATRSKVKLDVVRDRGSLLREVKNGVIENVYRLQVTNSVERPRRFAIEASGLPGLAIDSDAEFEVASTERRTLGVRLRVPPDAGESGSNRIRIGVRALDDPDVGASATTTFFLPAPRGSR